MSRTTTFLARHRGAAVLLGLLLLMALVLAGCGGEPTAVPTEPPEPTEVAVATVAPTEAPTEPPPTDVPTEEPTPEPTEAPTEPPPTATPTEEPTPEPVDDSGCITCHTDEETLKALAKEPEAAESLSEGEG
jgi:outer membrane biosynthesis protein TonB